jgi:two-component sensor histidine kinase
MTYLLSSDVRQHNPHGLGQGLAGQQTVRDDRKRLKLDWKEDGEAGLGLKLIAALVKQLGAGLEIVDRQPGTEFITTAPVEPG